MPVSPHLQSGFALPPPHKPAPPAPAAATSQPTSALPYVSLPRSCPPSPTSPPPLCAAVTGMMPPPPPPPPQPEVPPPAPPCKQSGSDRSTERTAAAATAAAAAAVAGRDAMSRRACRCCCLLLLLCVCGCVACVWTLPRRRRRVCAPVTLVTVMLRPPRPAIKHVNLYWKKYLLILSMRLNEVGAWCYLVRGERIRRKQGTCAVRTCIPSTLKNVYPGTA